MEPLPVLVGDRSQRPPSTPTYIFPSVDPRGPRWGAHKQPRTLPLDPRDSACRGWSTIPDFNLCSQKVEPAH